MSLKQLQMRIRATTSTAKITKAMKMVAAAKLKGAERMMLAARPFAQSTASLMDQYLTPGEEDEAPERHAVAVCGCEMRRHVVDVGRGGDLMTGL